MEFHIVLYHVGALVQAVYVEHVAGIAGCCIAANAVAPVVGVAGVGAQGLHGGGPHITQLQVLQGSVGLQVKAYAQLVSHMQAGSGFYLLQAVTIRCMYYAPDGTL